MAYTQYNGLAGQNGGNVGVPHIEIRKLEQDYCEFLLTGTDASVANALRRVILSEVSHLYHPYTSA